MPIVIAVLIAVAGFIWWSWGRRRAGDAVSAKLDHLTARRDCSWTTTGDQKGRFVEYGCAACGVKAYSTTGRAPVNCQRQNRNRG